MKNILFSVFLFFLSGCATPEEAKTVFIDSNITADVYIGDVKVGTTPYMDKISGEKREMISLRKTGYKTAELPLKTMYKGNYRPGFFYAMAGITSSNCNEYIYDTNINGIYRYNGNEIEYFEKGRLIYNRESGKYKYFSGWEKVEASCAYVPIMTIPVYSSAATVLLLNDTVRPNSYLVQYDRDSYFVEMIPENKKTFTKEELKQMRTRLMVLRTFNELKASSPEYAFTLSRLTGKPFLPPAPDMTPGTYLRLIEK